MTMVMCNENNPGMYQARHSPPTNYNFTHFSGYMNPQGTQYPTQGQEYGQYPVDHGSFQQQCYMYGTSSRPGEEWMNYNMTPTTGSHSPQSSALGTYSYRTAAHNPMGLDYHQNSVNIPHGNQTLTVLGSPPPQSEGSPTTSTSSGGSCGSPTNKQLRPPFDWMKKTSYTATGATNGKTRTKDKYRVVYSDHQRLELEKEFHYSRYITIRRKAELAQNLALSERQVKIWFQNRRAKERKQNKKRDEAIGCKSESHGETSGHMSQMSLPVEHGQMGVPMVKPDPGEEYQSTTPMGSITPDHIKGHLQSTSLSVPPETSSYQQHSPLSVHSSVHIKMDPTNEIVTQS
ncbi:hypothetical protein KUTeg_024196 [Tegillarca granosa]|uniref:Homeobox domain-containing protein n=1 Tax=Tegillarca granosa TaxID=220873 RepID=A0ABQ9DXP3_TEGGR|nr:hypothetical protein KUTeg_024196 [Tegillarca granosa]